MLIFGFVGKQPSPRAKALWLGLIYSQSRNRGDGSLKLARVPSSLAQGLGCVRTKIETKVMFPFLTQIEFGKTNTLK